MRATTENERTNAANGAPPMEPLGGRLLAVRDDAQDKVGSLWLPDTAKEPPILATVVRLGRPERREDGSRAQWEVAVGDRIVFRKYSGMDVEHEGKVLLMVHERDILAKLEGAA